MFEIFEVEYLRRWSSKDREIFGLGFLTSKATKLLSQIKSHVGEGEQFPLRWSVPFTQVVQVVWFTGCLFTDWLSFPSIYLDIIWCCIRCIPSRCIFEGNVCQKDDSYINKHNDVIFWQGNRCFWPKVGYAAKVKQRSTPTNDGWTIHDVRLWRSGIGITHSFIDLLIGPMLKQNVMACELKFVMSWNIFFFHNLKTTLCKKLFS